MIWAAVIAGIAAVIGGIISSQGNKQSQERYNQAQMKLAEQQNAQQVDFWKMQNAYNDPSQQMNRLKNAGLNPNMLYGSGVSQASGNAGDVGKAAKPEIMPVQNAMQDVGQVIRNSGMESAQIMNMRAQNNLLNKQAALTQAETTNKLIQAVKLKAEGKWADDLIGGQVALQQSQIDKNSEEIKAQKMSNEITRDTIKDQKKRIEAEARKMIGEAELRKLEAELRRNGINPNDPTYGQILARILIHYAESTGMTLPNLLLQQFKSIF